MRYKWYLVRYRQYGTSTVVLKILIVFTILRKFLFLDRQVLLFPRVGNFVLMYVQLEVGKLQVQYARIYVVQLLLCVEMEPKVRKYHVELNGSVPLR